MGRSAQKHPARRSNTIARRQGKGPAPGIGVNVCGELSVALEACLVPGPTPTRLWPPYQRRPTPAVKLPRYSACWDQNTMARYRRRHAWRRTYAKNRNAPGTTCQAHPPAHVTGGNHDQQHRQAGNGEKVELRAILPVSTADSWLRYYCLRTGITTTITNTDTDADDAGIGNADDECTHW